MTMQAALRAAAVSLLEDYAADASIKLQVYRARPRSLHPPSAFVDRIRETVTYPGMQLYQRRPQADIVVLHGPSLPGGGSFDSGDAADQKDAFADGLLEWASTRYHEGGANTLVAIVATEDDPTWIPDWLPPEEQRTYYATVITLEGYAENNATV